MIIRFVVEIELPDDDELQQEGLLAVLSAMENEAAKANLDLYDSRIEDADGDVLAWEVSLG